jgi:acyl-coenzyme A synthetase/AMP-(fatty) acid ligase
MVPPGVDLAVSLYACWRAGAVIVLIDSGLGPSGMSAAIEAAAPDHLIGTPKAIAAARVLRWPGRRLCTTPLSPLRRRALGVVGDLEGIRARPAAPPEAPDAADVAAVVFTSGATGPSKGVVYTHGRLEAQRDALVGLYDITTDDRLVAAFAPFALYGPAMGISSIVPDMDVAAPGTLTAVALGDAARAIDATLVFASPAALANVVRTADELTDLHRAAFARVRILLSAGAPVRPSLLRAAAALFPGATAHTPYGMTECLPVASIGLDEIEGASGGDGVCVGFPLAGVDVRIRPLDDVGSASGEPTSRAGVLGEVVVRAAHARSGYDRLWHTELAASRPPGWHSTGDVGRLDELGRLWIGGRLGHVVSTARGPIAPVRSEQAVEGIDGIAAAAIVGVGPAGAQRIVAVVQRDHPSRSPRLAPPDVVDSVRAAVRSAVDEDAVAVLEVPELPVDRRHNSKVDRSRIAAWAGAVLAGGPLGRP